MTNHARMDRLGTTPLGAVGNGGGSEYRRAADREESRRAQPLGRALDLGCGRGFFLDIGWFQGLNAGQRLSLRKGLGWPMNKTAPR